MARGRMKNVAGAICLVSVFMVVGWIEMGYIHNHHASADMPWEGSNRGTLPDGGGGGGGAAAGGDIPAAVVGALSSLEASVAAAQARVGRLEQQYNALPALSQLQAQLNNYNNVGGLSSKTNGQLAAVAVNAANAAGGGGNAVAHFDNSALIARDASNVNEKTNMLEEVKGADGAGGVVHPLPVRPAKGASHGVTFTRLRKVDDGGPGNACGGIRTESASTASLTVEQVYQDNPFTDTEDHGPWTQGFPLTYANNEWDDVPLKIWVVPHSHNDPGWIHTVDEYFNKQTKQILNLMVKALSEDPTRTFVWAEISYFAMWWETTSESQKAAVKRLIQRKQLEIVTGGWVMPDEANTHYFALIDQLVEGHQWLEEHLGVKPLIGWSIDPFGHSPTMAYILKRAGLPAMIIQRIHYEVKRVLGEKLNLEFMWRQDWDRGHGTDIFTQMMPFYSYDVPHTCGPNPKVCCQFDFARLHKFGCPWKIAPKAITEHNIHERASTLLQQYRQKSKLFRSKVVLIPLGDDFRYDNQREVTAQFGNYKKLMNYINSQPNFKAQMRFGTLSDYFMSVADEHKVKLGEQPPGFNTLSGDFFTYADRKDNYWSGYFTSRPFYKHLDRVLEAAVRAAEIAYTLAGRALNAGAQSARDKAMPALVKNRRALALFQHHDGITGTAKDHVMKDYGIRMVGAVTSSHNLIAEMLEIIMLARTPDAAKPASHFLVPESERQRFDALPTRKVLQLVPSTPKAVVVYNPLGRPRVELVSVLVSTADDVVVLCNDKAVVAQVNPVWDSGKSGSIASDRYELWIEVQVPALGFATYLVTAGGSREGYSTQPATKATAVSTSIVTGSKLGGVFKVDSGGYFSDYTFESGDGQVVTFDRTTGFMKSVASAANGLSTTVQLQFVTYGVGKGKDRNSPSGAYIFMPNGNAVSYQPDKSPALRITKGPLVSEVDVVMSNVRHTVRVFGSKNGLLKHAISIQNTVDVKEMDNKELVMRIKTDVKNKKVFFTDLNGFAMRKRTTLDKLPMQANFFPLPGQAFWEDAKKRVSLHSRSSLGCASLDEGGFEVVLDRRLNQDDNRGLFQPVKDNKVTASAFYLTIEKRTSESPYAAQSPLSSTSYPTLYGNTINDYLNYPMYQYITTAPAPPLQAFNEPIAAGKANLPCDVHLVNLRSLETNNAKKLVLLHRKGFVCDFEEREMQCTEKHGEADLQSVFSSLNPTHAEETSLTMMHKDEDDVGGETFVATMNAMEVGAWKMQ